MAQAVQAPATAEGPTQHTQNQGEALLAGLDPDQLLMLREAIEEWRVGDDGKGHAAMEHWDVRRTLIRIFGIGGFDIIQTTPPTVIHVQEIKPDSGNGPSKWTVSYMAMSRLVIRNRRGVQLAVFEDGAIDEGLKQPSLTQAHDQGFKGAMSGALKRCAMNLGDQFGLSLYNKGKTKPVVYTFADQYRDLAVAAWDDFAEIGRIHGMAKGDDVLLQKVWNFDRTALVPLRELLETRGSELKPTSVSTKPATAQSTPTPTGGQIAEQSQPASESSDPVVDAVLGKFYAQAKENWRRSDVLTQIKEGARQKGVLGMQVRGLAPDRKPMPFEDFLDALIARTTAANRERNAT